MPAHPVPTAEDLPGRPPTTQDDRGFILITLGLLIVPIMVFAALSVDVASWYSRASELQRAADSASLAGVVWMPEFGTAQSRATDSLNRNGITNGANDVTVSIAPGTEANSLRVCVRDNSAPQYFAAVFASPTSLERCATAQFNVPLQLGSPLNFFGGNTNLVGGYTPGPRPANAQLPVPANSVFGTSNYCQVRSTYPSGTVIGYWYRDNSWTKSNWSFIIDPNSYSIPNCNTTVSIPDAASFGGDRYCTLLSNSNRTSYWDSNNSSNPNDWRYRNTPPNNPHPDCGYGGTSNQPIPNAKSPGMWAAVLGPSNSRANGDVYSTTNGLYRSTGYWYSIDIPKSGVTGPVSVQVFDANTNCVAPGGCRTPMGDDSGPAMYYAVLDGGTTPYDMSDDTLLCSRTIANGSNATYNVRWHELCNIGSPVAGRRYYVNVRSTSGNNYNGYALRAVAGTYPAACLDYFPVGDVTCYGATGSVQPALSAYGDMEMYNGIKAGTPTKFFLANVKKVYAGKTLRIRLWDPGDGNGNISVQILKPGPVGNSPEAGVPVPSCTWTRTEYNGTLSPLAALGGSSGTLNGADGCKMVTTSSSTMYFQDRWVDFRIDIPDTYDCDDTRDPLAQSGSCWWQIKYETSNSTSDYTTWSAEIIGDPVRLTQ